MFGPLGGVPESEWLDVFCPMVSLVPRQTIIISVLVKRYTYLYDGQDVTVQ